MNNKNIIVLPEKLSESRAKILYKEFEYAWERTSNKEKLDWAKESIRLFGKVTFRRGKGFVKTIGYLLMGLTMESINFGVAVYNKNGYSHLQDRTKKTVQFVKDASSKSINISKNIFNLLKNKPKETAPIIFLGILGFFTGAGTKIGEKAWYDIDGGICDLDLVAGKATGIDLLGHRSPFFHSIISAAVLETLVFSSVKAINIFHSKLPENHDLFWDKVNSKNDWAKAFISGACTGIAYHLLIDGTLDGGGKLSGLNSTFGISMSQESHQAFFISNAVAEGLDINKKEIKTN